MVLLLVGFKAVIIVGVPDEPGPVSILLRHHQWVCEQLSSNNVALGPRSIKLNDLDTSIHSVYSEHRLFTVDLKQMGRMHRGQSVGGTEYVASRAVSSPQTGKNVPSPDARPDTP